MKPSKAARETLLRLSRLETNWTHEQRDEYIAAKREFVAAGYCPTCYICDDDEPALVSLCPWEPGDTEHHAGRACPQCEDFFKCGEQPEYQDQATEYRGDADPGL